MNKITMTVEELADSMGISKNTAYSLVKRPGFPAIKVSPRRIVIPIIALEKWLKESRFDAVLGNENDKE